MPIYEYACRACGHQLEVLQKISDDPLTDCAACGMSELQKQISSTSFQLKGTGWYVTDFKDGQKKKAPSESVNQSTKSSDKKESKLATTDGASAKGSPVKEK